MKLAVFEAEPRVRPAEKGFDIYQALMEHDVATALRATGDAVITGPSGTNVND